MKIMIVDGNSILNRAFYAIRLLTAPDGTPTNAIYGFLNIFYKYLNEQQPDCVAICFDVKRKTFRNDIYVDYKGTRKPMPEELRVQLPLIKEILTSLGFKVLGLENYEADDLIGTLSSAASREGNTAVIVTGDRDSLQLVDNNVTVLLPSTKMGKTETTVYTPEAVLENMGVTPEQIVDLKALMGDSSDNIPGVAGIGQKTAADLISRFKNLDRLYSELNDSDLRDSVKAKLLNGKDSAYLSKTLATINREAPVETGCCEYKINKTDKAAAATLFMRLNLMSFMEKFSLNASDAVKEEKEPIKTREITLKRIASAEELEKTSEPLYFLLKDSIIYALDEKNLYLCPDIEGVFKLKRQKYTFDSKALYLFALKNHLEISELYFDLKLAAYLLEPTASSYELSELITRYGEDSVKCEYTLGFGDDEVTIKEVLSLPYLCKKLENEIKAKEMTSLLREIEMPLSETLSNMEFVGFSVNREGLSSFDKELSQMIDDLKNKIYKEAEGEFNINSPKQLGEVLFERLGLPAKKKTKTGYSTNAEVLEGLKNAHPIVKDILEYRKVSKLKSTYTEGLLSKISPDGRIHTTFLQTETRTGRLSSVEPNLQNIPVRTELGSRLREFFVADEGNTLVDADYSQIELRVLAHIANDKNMIDAFKNGEDIHTATAARIHNLPKEFITPEVRRSAKAVNFGIVYGIGAFSLSQDIGVSVKEASRLINSYLENYNGVADYMKKTVTDGEQNGYVETLFKRRRDIKELQSSNKLVHAAGERIAMNTPIQGTAADIIKISMNKVFNRLKKDVPDARLILQVHDELIVECKKEDAMRVSDLVKEEMQSAADLLVCLEADVHTGENWLLAKG